MFQGPVIQKLDGALGAKGQSEENIAGLCLGGVVTVDYPTLGTVVKLIQASDANALGLNASYDIANKVLVREHIDEFFRRNPNGTLYLQLVAQGTTLTNMCDKANNFVKKIIIESGKKVKYFGVVLNPASGYIPTNANGLDADVEAAIIKAQQLVDDFATQNVFIDIAWIEGRGVNGTISSMKNLRTMASSNVQVVIFQDPAVAALDSLYAKYAAVGTVMGDHGIRRAEEDLGSLQVQANPNKAINDYPLDNIAQSRYLKIALSSGVETKNLTSAEIKYLKDNGYVFADFYPEYSGVFISGSPTCTALTSDYAYAPNVRVWNKAARIAVAKLTPKINSTVEIDDAGKLKSTTITAWQVDVNNSRNGLGTLVVDGHALKTACFIDPNQNVYASSKVEVGMTVKPFVYAREIVGKLGFSIN
jgi:Protein of unknown function (DUF2586)